MASKVTIRGGYGFKQKLKDQKASLNDALRAGTIEALDFLEQKAREILDTEIYDKNRDPYARELDKNATDAVYNTFVKTVIESARGSVRGELTNNSPHAMFLEHGTDDEGTGSHFIPIVNAGALHWINPVTGADSFSKGHEVKGIVPIRFMEKALKNNKVAVRTIFRRHLDALIHG